jgi:hypothetical protein
MFLDALQLTSSESTSSNDAFAFTTVSSILQAWSFLPASVHSSLIPELQRLMEQSVAVVEAASPEECTYTWQFSWLSGVFRALDENSSLVNPSFVHFIPAAVRMLSCIDAKFTRGNNSGTVNSATPAAEAQTFDEDTEAVANSPSSGKRTAGKSKPTSRKPNRSASRSPSRSRSPRSAALRQDSKSNLAATTPTSATSTTSTTTVSSSTAAPYSIHSSGSTSMLEKLGKPRRIANALSGVRCFVLSFLGASIGYMKESTPMLDQLLRMVLRYVSEEYVRKACLSYGSSDSSRNMAQRRHMDIVAKALKCYVPISIVKGQSFVDHAQSFLLTFYNRSHVDALLASKVSSAALSQLLLYVGESLLALHLHAQVDPGPSLLTLSRFLCDADSFFCDHSQEFLLRDALVHDAALIAKDFFVRSGSFSSSSLLLSDLNLEFRQLTSIDDHAAMTDRNLVRLTNIILLCGRMAVLLREQSIVDNVLSMLIDFFSLSAKPSLLPAFTILIEQLVDLASASDMSHTYREVLDTIFGFFERFADGGPTEILQVLHAQTLVLATNTVNPDHAWNLLHRSLRHTHRLGFLAHSRDSNAGDRGWVALQGQFGYFLPVIATLMSRSAVCGKLASDEANVRLFRRFWFYVIICGFLSEKAVWIEDWQQALRVIPARSPPLMCRKAYNFVEVESEVNALVRGKVDAGLFEKLKRELMTLCPSSSSAISRFSFADTVYCLSVFYLEGIRSAQTHSFRTLMYIEDMSIFDRTDLYGCVESICDLTCRQLLSESLREEEASHLAQSLLVYFCHTVRAVRRQCKNLLVEVSRRYPSVLWDRECVETMLSLMRLLAEAVDDTSSAPLCYHARGINMTVSISESLRDRQDLLERVSTLTGRWLSSASQLAPRAIQDMVDECILRFCQLTQTMHPSVYTVAMKALDPRLFDAASNNENRLAGRVAPVAAVSSGVRFEHVINKAFFAGEFQTFDFERLAEYKRINLPLIVDALQNARDPFTVSVCIQRAMAYVTQIDADLSVLRLLTTRAFDFPVTSVAKSACSAWGWFFTSCKNRDADQIVLLSVIVRCWEETVHKGIGLFSPEGNLDVVDFHDAVLSFLYEQMLVVAERGPEYAALFYHFVCASLSHSAVDSLCPTMDARAARFRLLSMALRVIHLRQIKQGHVLLPSIVRCALLFFAHPPGWMCSIVPRDAEAEASLILAVCHQIEVERSLLRRRVAQHRTAVGSHTIGSGAKYVLQLPDDTASVRSSRAGGAKSQASFPRSVTSQGEFPRSDSQWAERESVTTATIVGDQFDASSLSNKMSLLVLLLRHEVERIQVWFNPQNDRTKDLAVLVFDPSAAQTAAPQTARSAQHPQATTITISAGAPSPSDKAVTSTQGETPDMVGQSTAISVTRATALTRDQWRNHIWAAWEETPLLAFSLYVRFHFAHVRAELEVLTRKFASVLQHIPEAVPFLVTKRSIDEDHPELTYLSDWTPGSLEDTFPFLDPAFSKHPAVRRYVLKSLKSCSARELVFFLPQIIQTLRHDATNEVANMLQTVARLDRALAHQLLWALRTENRDSPMSSTKMARDMVADTVLSNKCKVLYEAIVADFTKEDESFYLEEFGFFDDLIQISGRLREVEKGPLRKKALLDEVAHVKLRDRVYLPTDTKLRLVGIQREKCLPMQSAAKSPILVPFEMIEDDVFSPIPEPHTRLPDSSVLMRSCILKMGDDCRQDQLALQIISLFKRIFDAARLPLYLFPYRVITVAHGCGIIECVPRTMSRDQLGHQVEGGLYDWFIQRFGHKDSIEFQRARRNFVRSMAAYSVVSFILNIKDRHNGNILISEEGHIIHIDFGFIYDISPGGDFNFESSPFKLTTEMLAVMGMGIEEKKKRINSEPFSEFVDGVVRGFLAARPHMDTFIALTNLMLESGLPCFKPDTMRNLRARFAPDMNERDAAQFMVAKVEESYENLRTVIYDQFQRIAEGIQC